jgi:hypothetical protein
MMGLFWETLILNPAVLPWRLAGGIEAALRLKAQYLRLEIFGEGRGNPAFLAVELHERGLVVLD